LKYFGEYGRNELVMAVVVLYDGSKVGFFYMLSRDRYDGGGDGKSLLIVMVMMIK
jgi:hypothetical protein